MQQIFIDISTLEAQIGLVLDYEFMQINPSATLQIKKMISDLKQEKEAFANKAKQL